jgi:hypothetical protein
MTDAAVIDPDSSQGVVFRCQMLDRDGEVLFPADIIAETLDIAVQQAFHIRRTRNQDAAAAERVYAFRVWHDPPVG